MSTCNSCGAEIRDPKQIVCLACGAIATQPVVERVQSASIISDARERTKYTIFRLLPDWNGVYGRLDFLKGEMLLWVASAFAVALVAILMQINEALGVIAAIVMFLWVVIQNLALLLGRLYDLGCHSQWSRVLGIILLFVPIVSVVTVLVLFLAPRGTLSTGTRGGSDPNMAITSET